MATAEAAVAIHVPAVRFGFSEASGAGKAVTPALEAAAPIYGLPHSKLNKR